MNPKSIAESIVGPVQWDTAVGGFCRCPGESAHTASTGPRDCRVRIDGAPTIFCFHTHCSDALQKANLELRRQLGSADWTLKMPDGRKLRSGEHAQAPPPQSAAGLRPGDITLLQEITSEGVNRRTRILEEFYWPYDHIVEDSPLAAASRDPIDQFRLWLRLWPPDAVVWIGDVYHSGPEHSGHFRPVSDWQQVGPVMGNFTCPSSFKPGSCSRADDSVLSREFLVVESDTLSRDEVGAIFLWLYRELSYPLRCIVDTGGKSLHAWFSPPPAELFPRLKAALTTLGCDPKLFGRSQPVRVPGAFREQKLQRLLWINL